MDLMYTPLEDQIARAQAHYEKLCNLQNELLTKCKTYSEELLQVEKAINDLCGSISSATKMSNIGAPQAVEALQSAGGRLNTVYQLLRSGRNYPQINLSSGVVSGKMIHVTPGIGKIQKHLEKLSQEMDAHSRATRQHSSSLSDQQSTDTDVYQSKADQLADRLTVVAGYMEYFARHLEDADSRYAEAQKTAIYRAKRIPH